MATILIIKASRINNYENRVNALVLYGNKNYAVSCTTAVNVNKNYEYTIYTRAIKYLEIGVKASSLRDREIINALNNSTYVDYKQITKIN